MRHILLGLALILTGALYPATYTIAAHNGRDGQPAGLLLVTLCLLRGAALAGAGIGFGWAVVLEVACAGALFLSIDKAVQAPFGVIFGVVAFLAPFGAIAGVWLGQRNVVMVAVGVVVVARLGGWGFYGPLTEAWRAPRRTTPQVIPAGADLLDYAGPEVEWDRRHVARAGLRVERLMGELDGGKRMVALSALTERMGELDGATREKCWRAVGDAAREMREPGRAEIQTLYEALQGLSRVDTELTEPRRAVGMAVRDAVLAAQRRGVEWEGTLWVDRWLAGR